MEQLIISVSLAMLVLIALASGLKIVPQGFKYIVQRLGKYNRTLDPGLSFIVPFVDNVAYKFTTKDLVLDVPRQEVISKDNAVLIVNAVAYINIAEPQKAAYGVEDYADAIQKLVQTSLRAIVGEMNLDDALSSREQIKYKLKTNISDEISGWGVVVKTVEIQDIQPSITMQKAMEAQAAAERSKRAAITTAEGEKQAVILESEGVKEAAQNEAEAKIRLAEASAKSIAMVAEQIKEQQLPAMYLLGEKYVDNIIKLSESDNAKTIVLPADLPAALRGLLGGGSTVGK